MKWSWKIARVAGIDVYMHSTFLLLIGWFAISYWLAQRSIPYMLEGLAFLLALFASVLLHEFGHALTARRYGITTRDITLLPIGGVARLERMPENPREELRVALAGPAVNVVIAAFLLVVLLVTGGMPTLANLSATQGGFLERMLVVNITLAIFNLIPAFPMDGGRVIRALLATRMEYTRATQIAANIGQGIALIFGFFGLFNNPMLLFIAFFVWIGAAQEASMVQVKSALSGIPVDRAMLTNFETLSPTDSLARPVQMILAGSQQDFPVVSPSGAVVGILTREALIRGLSQQGENTLVSYVMDKNITAVDSHQMLDDVSRQMQTGGHNVIPVIHNGLLVGLMTMDNIGEFLMIQAAIKARKTDRRDIIPT